MAENFCSCGLIEGVENLYIIITAYAGEKSASVEIQNFHSNITKITKNGAVIYSSENGFGICDAAPEISTTGMEESKDSGEADCPDKSLLNVREILEFGETVRLSDIHELIARQIECNVAISEEGLKNPWGAQVGRTLLDSFGTGQVVNRAKAAAAAGSDARMSGCPMPVVINSGSGNQGMTVSLPVVEYAKEYIGSLSAYCAAKIACAVDCALTALHLSRKGLVFQPGEGLVKSTVEETIQSVGRMGREGMKATDIEILNIMLEN